MFGKLAHGQRLKPGEAGATEGEATQRAVRVGLSCADDAEKSAAQG